MKRRVHLALLASAIGHAVAAAILHGPRPPAPAVPPLTATLRFPILPAPAGEPEAMREAPSRPYRAGAPRPAVPQVAAAPETASAPMAMSVAPAEQTLPVSARPAADSPVPALELPRFDADYLANPPPAYPVSARRRGIEGTVLLDVRVGPGGEAREVKLARGAGETALDEAAYEAVRGWRFVPARRGAEAVEAWVRIPVVFRL